ncbi:MAG: hypothetical protein GF347_04940, partial [Candidatus Moranbacteria bacterium]|nr:hypothetical protein [Candidatus Moranbacteria bacterium]
MGKIIELTQYKGRKAKPRRYIFRNKIKVGLSTLGFFTILIIFALSILYLTQANRTATYGYEIKE